MSALEIYLKGAQDMRGMWHKERIRDVRNYIAVTPREEIISAIHQIKEQSLLRILWEVGLDTELQQIVTKQSEYIEKQTAGVR